MVMVTSSPLLAGVVAAGAAALVVAGAAGCDNGAQCTRNSDCELDFVCTVDLVCVPAPPIEPFRCVIDENADSSPHIDATRGFPADDTKWSCPMPQTVEGDGPRILASSPTNIIAVSGVPTNIRFDWGPRDDLAAGTLIYGIEGTGYFARDIDSTFPSPFNAEIFIKPFAPNAQLTFFMGIDPGLGTQEEPQVPSFVRVPLRVLSVGSGDIQVNVFWDTSNDLDLHVLTPDGEHVYWELPLHQVDDVTIGELDLDSNINCPAGGDADKRNENMFWGDGQALPGHYTVYLQDFGNAIESINGTGCGVPSSNYTVIVVLDGVVANVASGTIGVTSPTITMANNVRPMSELATEFDYPATP